MSKPINFISDRKYRWMSNFYGAPIRWQGIIFPTVEHAFQYHKTEDKEWQKIILASKTPGDAKRNGRKCPMRRNWDTAKESVMSLFVGLKFEQHPDLAKRLLETGQRPIKEDAPWDSFWGTGKDGKGKNMMGKILSHVRKKLWLKEQLH